MRTVIGVSVVAALVSGWPARAAAQTRPAPIVEAVAGYAGFVDEAMDGRAMTGAGARLFVSPRLAIGPEFVYLNGADGAHDWTLTGNATIDLVVDATPSRRAVPYLAFGGGMIRQTQQVGTGPFTSSEGTLSGGVGARFALGKRLYIAPEVRVGWEPEIRVGVTVGVRPRRN